MHGYLYRPLQRTSITWNREFITDLKFRTMVGLKTLEGFKILYNGLGNLVPVPFGTGTDFLKKFN